MGGAIRNSRGARRWLAVMLVVVLAACGQAGSPPGAAEPAEAPPAASPDGTVVTVGDSPEGAVADRDTGLLAVAVRNPTALVLVDAYTATITIRIPLPSQVRHLQLAGPRGPVLVPLEGSGALVTIGLPDGQELSRVPIGTFAHDATATASGVVAVADERGGALVLVRDDRVIHRFTDVTQPGGVAAVGDLVALIDVHDHVLAIYDAARQAAHGKARAGDGPTHVIADRRGRLLVADTRGDRLLTFTATPQPRQVGSAPLPGAPYGMAYDPTRDRLWVTLTRRNEVVGLDLAGDIPREVARFATVRQPNTVAVDPATGRIFITGTMDGTLQLIDPPK